MCRDLPLPLPLLLGSHPIRWAAGIGGGGGVKRRVEGQLGGVQEAVAQSPRTNNNSHWLQLERAELSFGAAFKVSFLQRHPQDREARDRGTQESI